MTLGLDACVRVRRVLDDQMMSYDERYFSMFCDLTSSTAQFL